MATAFDQALAHFIGECAYVLAVHDLITKWRIEMVDGYFLDVYFNDRLGKYSYTLIKGEERVLGWDNAPHHPDLTGFPHHLHHLDGSVQPSNLTGLPEVDLEVVRQAVEALLERKSL